ncbi:hypothetical protein M0R45_026824 [Rubus argutus]|uniref:Uncharacterized protein n=1 Tax=Rubus argutus TaxID=59490 RepID=A0AAW1WYJ9_RUBAR
MQREMGETGGGSSTTMLLGSSGGTGTAWRVKRWRCRDRRDEWLGTVGFVAYVGDEEREQISGVASTERCGLGDEHGKRGDHGSMAESEHEIEDARAENGGACEFGRVFGFVKLIVFTLETVTEESNSLF